MMFATETSVTQLSAESVLRLVTEEEEKQWLKVDITTATDNNSLGNSSSYGTSILRFGSTVKKIENYFSQLEPRKCCLRLAGRRTRFSNVRLVGKNNEANIEGAEKSSKPVTEVLNSREFQAFQHAYLCASFPALGVPDPPSPCSSSPDTVLSDGVSKFIIPGPPTRPSTPHSLHDSGVEAEHDDAAMIPTESLCDMLCKCFCLSSERFRQYEREIIKKYHRKTPPQLLAEDLFAQLVALENNSNNFYSPHNFLSRYGYENWQQRERTQIAEMLNKFWHFALPFPRNSQSHLMELKQVHEDYEILLSKLLKYESQFKNDGSDFMTPLSSASVRLLREFALRYGIGDRYRKILYLHHVVENFNPCIWYLSHIMSLLMSIKEWFPSNHIQPTMVRQEFILLDSAVKAILTQSSKCLCQMKSLFPKAKAAQGIDILISLISLSLELRGFLTLEKPEPVEKFLYSAIQNMFRPVYEHHKVVARMEMQQIREYDTFPILLNILIGNIRDEVSEYKTTYQTIFQRYLNITKIAAQCFYSMLMEDVKDLCCNDTRITRKQDINLLMLGLVYRLGQLDHDWSHLIPMEAQTWRSFLQGEIIQWCSILKTQIHTLVLETVAGDSFQMQSFHLDDLMSEISSTSSTLQSPNHTCFTQSINSAFSSLVSPELSPTSKQESKTFEGEGQTSHPAANSETKEHDHQSDGPVQPVRSDTTNSHTQRTSTPNDADDDDGDADSVVVVQLRRSSSLPSMHGPDSAKNSFSVMSASHKKGGYVPVICGDLLGDINDYESKLSALAFSNSDSLEDLNEELKTGKNSQEDRYSVKSENWESESGNVKELTDDKNVSPVRKSSVESGSVNIDTAEEKNEIEQRQSSNYESDEVFDGSEKTFSSSFSDSSPSEVREYPKLKQLPNFGSSSLKQEDCDDNETFSAEVLKKAAGDNDHLEVGSLENSLKRSVSESRNMPHSRAVLSKGRQSVRPEDFLESFQSDFTNVSLPENFEGPEASLPLSSSLIDMIVLLQRLVSFGRTLHQTLCFDKKYGCRTLLEEELTADQQKFYKHQRKRAVILYEVFLEAMCKNISLYCDNIFCLDLCGTPSFVARQLIGPQLVNYLTYKQNSQMIWGCRHIKTNTDCKFYVYRMSDRLSDRYEAVTQQMCLRINDIAAMIKCLNVFVKKLSAVFRIRCNLEMKPDQNSKTQTSVRRQESETSLQAVDAVDENSEWVESEVEETSDPATLELETPPASVKETLELQQRHLKHLFRAQTRLMAYRLNLFIQDALSDAMERCLTVPVTQCLQPLTKFLHDYLDKLSEWLHTDNFHVVLECLWLFTVQDFEKETAKLKAEDIFLMLKAKRLIHSIAYLIHFINNYKNGISRSLLLSQANAVIFQLQLFTLSTSQLLAVYSGLVKYCTVDDISTSISSATATSAVPAHILQKIHSNLQLMRKSFSGSDLVSWILQHRELFSQTEPSLSESSHPFYRDAAVSVAQSLLDKHLIADVDDADSEEEELCSSVGDVGYPSVILHRHSSTQYLYRYNDDDEDSLKKDDEEENSVKRHFNQLNFSANSKAVDRQPSCQDSNQAEDTSALQIPHSLRHSSVSNSGFDSMSSVNMSTSFEDSPFVDSSVHFYCVTPSAVLETSHISSSLEDFLEQHSKKFRKFHLCKETARLIEECFQRKITPMCLLTILYRRKHYDWLAKDFMEQLPKKLIDKIKNELDLPGNECIGS